MNLLCGFGHGVQSLLLDTPAGEEGEDHDHQEEDHSQYCNHVLQHVLHLSGSAPRLIALVPLESVVVRIVVIHDDAALELVVAVYPMGLEAVEADYVALQIAGCKAGILFRYSGYSMLIGPQLLYWRITSSRSSSQAFHVFCSSRPSTFELNSI